METTKGLWMTFSWHTRPHSGLCGRRRLTEGRHKTLKEAGQRGPLNKDADPTLEGCRGLKAIGGHSPPL